MTRAYTVKSWLLEANVDVTDLGDDAAGGEIARAFRILCQRNSCLLIKS